MPTSSSLFATKNIFLYVPNLIGYARVLLMIAAFYWISIPKVFLPTYTLSCLLDAFDGTAARALNQGTAKPLFKCLQKSILEAFLMMSSYNVWSCSGHGNR